MIGLVVGLAQTGSFHVDTPLPARWRIVQAEAAESFPLFPTPAQADLPPGLYSYTTLRRAFLFNAATDIADATMIAIPLIRDEGIDPAAHRCLGFALGGCSMWVIGAWWSTR